MTNRQTAVARAGILLWAPLIAAVIGCGNKVIQSPIAEHAPEWVNKGSGAFKDDKGMSTFYGVGIASKIQDRYLSVKTADERGRAEIAGIINTYIANLTKSYSASTSATDPKAVSEEQHVSATMKAFAQATLHGAMPIDHWKDPSDGTMFSLVKLDMEAVKKMLDETKELDSKVRDYVKANADKAFDELRSEEGKH